MRNKALRICITAVLIALLTVNNCFAIPPQNLVTEVQNTSSGAQISDDFSYGSANWTTSSVALQNKRLETTNASYFTNIRLKDTTVENINGRYRVRFSVASLSGGFMKLNFRVSTSSAFSLILRENSINYSLQGKAEVAFSKPALALGKDYEITVDLKDDKASIMLMDIDDGNNETIGTVMGIDKSKGYFSVSGLNAIVSVDKIEIWNNDYADIKLENKYPIINVGTSSVLSVENNTGKKLVWKSSDEKIATISENGEITALKGGNVTVTCQTADGKSADSANVTVYVPVSIFTPHTKSIPNLHVGDKELIQALYEPSDATNPNFKWSVSDVNVIQLLGSHNKWRTVEALNPGNAQLILTAENGQQSFCDITVLPQEEILMQTATFKADAFKNEIPEGYFGASSGFLMGIGTNTLKQYDMDWAFNRNNIMQSVIEDIGFSSQRFSQTRWNWKSGSIFTQLGEPLNHVSFEELVKPMSDMGIVQVLAFSTFSTVDEMIEEFEEYRKLYKGPYYLEYGNETYAISEKNSCADIETYVANLRQLYKRIKEIEPTAKVAVPYLSYKLERAIFSDPNNYPNGSDNMEYTQGIRALTWNATLSENTDCFDAVIPHIYAYISPINSRAENVVKESVLAMDFEIEGMKRQMAQIPQKELWVTEYNMFPEAIWYASDAIMRNQLQGSKSLGYALGTTFALLQMLENKKVTITSVHSPVDSQGFGLTQLSSEESVAALPAYHTYKEIGRLINKYKYFYGITPLSVNNENMRVKLLNQDVQYLNVQDVYAWAFGDETGIKEIAFMNVVKNPCTVELENCKLQPTWVYHSDNPLPDYLFAKATDYLQLPTENPVPEKITADFSEKIELSPYSLTVATVDASSQLQLSDEIQNKLSGNAVIKAGSKALIDAFGAVKYDEATAYAADGTYYIPIRRLADAFSDYISYENSDGRETVTILEYRHLMDDKSDSIDISAVKGVDEGLKLAESFYYKSVLNLTDGICEMLRSNKADASTGDIVRLNGKTYVSLKLAEKIFQKKAVINDELIILGNTESELSSSEIATLKTELER